MKKILWFYTVLTIEYYVPYFNLKSKNRLQVLKWVISIALNHIGG